MFSLMVPRGAPITVEVTPQEPVALVAERGAPLTIEVSPQGPPGPAGPSSASLTRYAMGVISGHRAVIGAGEGGAAYPDLSNPAHADLVLGVTTGAAQDGASLTVQVAGEIVEPSWAWDVSRPPVFCGPAGQLTQTPPAGAWLRQVGVATAPDRLIVQLRTPTLQ